MTPVIEMKPLSRTKRKMIFAMSFLLFIVAVPVSVFYAIGYRFDFTDKIQSIKSVGGMYVRNDTQNTEMFINNEPVVDMRVFQKAAYIQNLDAGMHRIHVQGDNVQTWVKELPVHAHFVTEVASFNLPKVPQVRLITKWSDTQTGAGIVFDSATTSELKFASTTNVLLFSTSTATTTFTANTEYIYIKSLFASSTELQATLSHQLKATAKKPFAFNNATSGANAIIATTTKSWREFSLFKSGSDVFISWEGDMNNVPYYFCINYEGNEKTTAQYGKHIASALYDAFASTTPYDNADGERLCRKEVRIDRKGQEVIWFDFFPDSTDIILMQLQDGLYAVEVDDRAWQNTQLLYPGNDIHVLQDGGRIFVHDGDNYVEVFTEISSQT